MRKAPGKQLGYIVLPIVVPSGVAPEDALRDNERYKVVWQVLQALRSHDERFHAMVNQIELNKRKPDQAPHHRRHRRDPTGPDAARASRSSEQLVPRLRLRRLPRRDVRPDRPEGRRAAVLGDLGQGRRRHRPGPHHPHQRPAQGPELQRRPRSSRSSSPACAATSTTASPATRRSRCSPSTSSPARLRGALRRLRLHGAQPRRPTMELMLASLDEHNLAAEQATLDRFYDSVRRRVEGIDNADGKQRVIVELYDKFFATAFKRTVDRLGIVYTPVEIVDFILQLRRRGAARRVRARPHRRGRPRPRRFHRHRHVHHPSAAVGPHRAARPGPQVRHRAARQRDPAARLLHRRGQHRDHLPRPGARLLDDTATYEPFPGLVLTDTFQSYEDGDRDDLDIFPENNERIARQRALPITVIVGNPPYSVGQDSANDDNANQTYPTIDAAIREHVRRTLDRDQQELAVRLLHSRHQVGLAPDRGPRRHRLRHQRRLARRQHRRRHAARPSPRSSPPIHVFNLRGNQRTAGEQSRREGGKVFGGGSRATVAITVLVKNPAASRARRRPLHRHRRLPHPRGEARQGRRGRQRSRTRHR